jgi:hypothetical protein
MRIKVKSFDDPVHFTPVITFVRRDPHSCVVRPVHYLIERNVHRRISPSLKTH